MKSALLLFVAIVMVVTASGCPVGRISPIHRDELIDTLREFWVNWDDYHIRYIEGPFPPGALVYDPKGDDRTIQSDVGDLITDHDTLAKRMKEIKRYGGVVYRIRGKDNWFFGYLYTGKTRSLSTSVEDDKNLRIHSLRDVHGAAHH